MERMDRNVRTLAKYLLTKGVDFPSKIQKLLFFMRVQEIRKDQTQNSFFKLNENFQAWIYGPVNVDSYKYLQPYFDELDEKENFLLDEDEVKEIDKQYLESFEKWNKYSAQELVEISHSNKAWIKARGNLGVDEICKDNIDEQSKDFVEFIDSKF